MSALAIFNPQRVPTADSAQVAVYRNKSTETVLNHYGKDKPALTLNEEETVKSAVLTPEVLTECIAFCALSENKPGDCIALRLIELTTNEMLVTMLQKLHKVALICSKMLLPTVSVERRLSKMKLTWPVHTMGQGGNCPFTFLR